jgi:hypothetical protein
VGMGHIWSWRETVNLLIIYDFGGIFEGDWSSCCAFILIPQGLFRRIIVI